MEFTKFGNYTDTELGTWESNFQLPQAKCFCWTAARGTATELGIMSALCPQVKEERTNSIADSSTNPAGKKVWVFMWVLLPHHHTQISTFYLILRDGIIFQGHNFVICFPLKGAFCSPDHDKHLHESPAEGPEQCAEGGSTHSYIQISRYTAKAAQDSSYLTPNVQFYVRIRNMKETQKKLLMKVTQGAGFESKR